jgi:hypothetical protein
LFDLEGDVAQARKPSANDAQKEVWLRLATAHADVEAVNALFSDYMEKFG